MSELKRYTVWLFKSDGESAGIDRVIDTSDDLDALRLSYWRAIIQYSDRLIMCAIERLYWRAVIGWKRCRDVCASLPPCSNRIR